MEHVFADFMLKKDMYKKAIALILAQDAFMRSNEAFALTYDFVPLPGNYHPRRSTRRSAALFVKHKGDTHYKQELRFIYLENPISVDIIYIIKHIRANKL